MDVINRIVYSDEDGGVNPRFAIEQAEGRLIQTKEEPQKDWEVLHERVDTLVFLCMEVAHHNFTTNPDLAQYALSVAYKHRDTPRKWCA